MEVTAICLCGALPGMKDHASGCPYPEYGRGAKEKREWKAAKYKTEWAHARRENEEYTARQRERVACHASLASE